MSNPSSSASAGPASGRPNRQDKPDTLTTVRETLTSLIVAFAMALIARAFLLEAFLIPTGSMAPTLLGKHIQARSPETGFAWANGPVQYIAATTEPTGVQRGPNGASITLTDPLTSPPATEFPADVLKPGVHLTSSEETTRSGDRVFVLKYIYGLYNPSRFDVTVFKNPTDPNMNFIKRLVGLPGDEIALADGDVFFRAAGDLGGSAQARWTGDDWRIARKPLDIQRAVWWPVWDSARLPASDPSKAVFPWTAKNITPADTPGRFSVAAEGGSLVWEPSRWPITDFTPYNVNPLSVAATRYPVADVRLRAAVVPDADAPDGSLTVRVRLRAQGIEYLAEIDGGSARLSMTAADATGRDADVVRLEQALTGKLARGLPAGELSVIEFWHWDQTLALLINDEIVLGGLPGGDEPGGAYAWSPMQRLTQATGLPADAIAEDVRALLVVEDSSGERAWRDADRLAANFLDPAPAWEFEGAAAEVRRLDVSRDLYYRPASYPDALGDPRVDPALAGRAAVGTHPSNPLVLGAKQYFFCGDNSAASLDGRLWNYTDPLVSATFPHATLGVVPQELLVGKAFFVYFPALGSRVGVPVPDAGSMRVIR